MIMNLRRPKRVGAIDILQNDFEYCTISYYLKNDSNELGEPRGTLIQRSSNVKCCIDILPSNWRIFNKRGYEMSLQGYTEDITNYMVVNAEQEIEKGDIVTDYNDVRYEVLAVNNWYTHKDVFMRKID